MTRPERAPRISERDRRAEGVRNGYGTEAKPVVVGNDELPLGLSILWGRTWINYAPGWLWRLSGGYETAPQARFHLVMSRSQRVRVKTRFDSRRKARSMSPTISPF